MNEKFTTVQIRTELIEAVKSVSPYPDDDQDSIEFCLSWVLKLKGKEPLLARSSKAALLKEQRELPKDWYISCEGDEINVAEFKAFVQRFGEGKPRWTWADLCQSYEKEKSIEFSPKKNGFFLKQVDNELRLKLTKSKGFRYRRLPD